MTWVSWSEESEFSKIKRKNKERRDTESSIISAANNTISLYDVLTSYGIQPVKNNENSDWSAGIRCPLPSHKNMNEKTPSFGYNFKEDRFYCFGCKGAGRGVEFIAEKEGKEKLLVAQKVLDDNNCSDITVSYHNNSESIKDIEKILFDVSSAIRKARKFSDNKIAIDNIDYVFDKYLSGQLGRPGGLDVENLSIVSERILELINSLESC